MKKFVKALAVILTVATMATIPAMAEETAEATENTAVEAQESKSVESYFGTNVDEAGTALGLEKTQTQSEGEDGAYLTMYEDANIMVGGHDGVIVDISLFTDVYSMYGVKIGMTPEEAKAALDEQGVTYTEGTVAELGCSTIEFKAPDQENAVVSFEINDNRITDAHMYTESNADEAAPAEETAAAVTAEEETAEEEPAEETVQTTSTSKATSPVKASGYIKLTGDAHLRKSADKESKSLKVMSKGTKLKYTATCKDSRGVKWYKVTSGKKTGWVSSKNTKTISKSEYNKSSSKKAHGYIELTGKCNVRKSPDKDSKKLDTFAKGSVLEYTATAKDSRGVKWYKVSADGVTGWISSKNAKKVDD